MASFTPFYQSPSLLSKTQIKVTQSASTTLSILHLQSSFAPKRLCLQIQDSVFNHTARMPLKTAAPIVVSATTAEKTENSYPGESKGFVEEMRSLAMRLHTKEQAKEGEKVAEKPEEKAVHKWEPSVVGYLRFLVDSKLVYDTLEEIVEKAAFPIYSEFKNNGLERSEALTKDLGWFREQGYTIPEPSSSGITYSQYLKEVSEKDPQAFICHFYNIYFGHTAGGLTIGKKVAAKILKELEFYKWDEDLSQLLQNVRDKLNKVAESWTREQKNRCLEETEISFKHSREIFRLILS